MTGVALTREHMNRITNRRNGQVVAAVERGEYQWCAVANAEVAVPPNMNCLWCGTDHTFKARLTNRQVESMRMLAAGRSRKEIARLLECSETTVANDWRDIRRALGASTTAQAVVMLVREGTV